MSGLNDKSNAERAEQFRVLVDAVRDYAIFMLGPQGHVTSWNSGAQRIKGYTADEIIGSHFSRFYTEEDRLNHKPDRILDLAAQLGRIEQEGWRVRKDGSRFWANVTLTAIRDHEGKLLGFGKVTRDFSERRKMEDRLHESERSLRELSLHLLRSQDEERRRIGRDLHDSLGQYLAALKMHLELLGRGRSAEQHLAEAIRLTDESIKEVRTLSYLLHPPLLEESGLASAAQWYLDGFSSRSQIDIKFEKAPDFPRLSRDLELAMFRILQEALTNVHRHSGSRTARVRLLTADDAAVLEISDDGRGIAPEVLDQVRNERAPGIGLRGMTERMHQLGGELQVQSVGRNGTTVTAMAPLGRGAVSSPEERFA